MLLSALVFLLGAGAVFGAYALYTKLPVLLASRRIERRLSDLSGFDDVVGDDASIVRQAASGALPAFDRLVEGTRAGGWTTRLIEQSGYRTTPGTLVLITVLFAAAAALAASVLSRQWFLPPVAAGAAAAAPTAFLLNRRTARFRAFEEQFPEALDLLARALKAGHAFQTAMGMVAEELREPVGPEFKKTFDQQNFGLPLRDALHQLTERVPIIDTRFFVTAVLIQRETGGNLSEILENLAHVVRERFKILRQVRVHTAHGRFTAFVLLSLPAALAVALSFINPEHMDLLFKERMGQTMLLAAIVMQAIGFVWIRKVIKIEV